MIARRGRGIAVLLLIADGAWLVAQFNVDALALPALRFAAVSTAVCSAAFLVASKLKRTAKHNSAKREEAAAWSIKGYDEAFVRTLFAKHGLEAGPLSCLSGYGASNDVWASADLVIRIPKSTGAAKEMEVESVIAPVAEAAGVRLPRLLHDGQVNGAPYKIYECANGHMLGTLPPDIQVSGLLADLGSQIAGLHRVKHVDDPQGVLPIVEPENAPHCLRLALAKGALDGREGKAVAGWISKLRRALDHGRSDTLLHNDLHPWNLIVEPETVHLEGIIDWGHAGWGDAAYDFAGFTLPQAFALLEAARSAGESTGKDIEGRILWQWLSLALWEMAELDMSHYQRSWWRWPEGGMDEVTQTLRGAPPEWKKWAA